MRTGAGLWTERRWWRLSATCTHPRGSPWSVSLNIKYEHCFVNDDLIPWIILQETAIERANDVFEKLDVNDDGSLDEQEFVDGCMNDERLAQLLNTGSGQQHINLEEELETAEEHGEQCWWWKFKYIFSGLLIVLFLANLYQSVPIETWYVVYLFFFIYHFYHILYHGW